MVENNKDIKLEVELLKRDIGVFDKYFQKIDSTLEKLGEVAAQVTRIIALHEEKIEQTEETSKEIKNLIEERRQETHASIEDLERKIDAQAGKLEETSKHITDRIDDLKKELVVEIGKNKDKTDNRIKKLEIWRYIVIGGALVVFFFFSQFSKSYFDKYWFEQTKVQIQNSAPITVQPSIKAP